MVVSAGAGATRQKQGLPQSITVQQIQQIVKSEQVVSTTPASAGGGSNSGTIAVTQQLPHSAILAAVAAKAGPYPPATVKALVIPVSHGALNAAPQNTVIQPEDLLELVHNKYKWWLLIRTKLSNWSTV